MKKRGQIAIEYLMIVGFTVVIIAILSVIYFNHQESSKFEIGSAQVDRILKKLVDTSEEVFFLGYPTKTTLKIYMPSIIDDISITTKEVVFTLRTGTSQTEMEQASSVNLSGTISSAPGIKYIEVKAEQGYVCIMQQGLGECP